MATGTHYFWLKLRDDFFKSKRIKKLRNMAGGDTYVIIYLKMQLLAMKNDGIIRWTGLEDKFADELALDLDEKADDVEVTLMYLLRVGLAETSDNIDFFFPYAVENTGSETSAAKRMREMRARNNVTLECNNVTQELPARYTEIEKEKDIELDIEKDKKKRKRFTPPTLEEVKAYCEQRNSSVDPVQFFEYFTADPDRQWIDAKGNKVTNWKSKILTWEKFDKPAAQRMNKTERYVASMRNENHKHTPEEMKKLMDALNKI